MILEGKKRFRSLDSIRTNIMNLMAASGKRSDLNTRHVLEHDRLKHVLGVSVDDDDVLVECGSLRDEVHSSLSLFLLQLQ